MFFFFFLSICKMFFASPLLVIHFYVYFLFVVLDSTFKFLQKEVHFVDSISLLSPGYSSFPLLSFSKLISYFKHS